MNFWIFQAKKNETDVTKLMKGHACYWRVTRYKHEMSSGDIVFLWQAGPPAGRGIYAWGKLRSQAYLQSPSDSEYSVSLRVERKLRAPLISSSLGAVPKLTNLSIRKNAQGTNFKITRVQAAEIANQIPRRERPPIPDVAPPIRITNVNPPTSVKSLAPEAEIDFSKTLAIILGASEWPEDILEPSPAFLESSRGFLTFLKRNLKVPHQNVLDLFNSDDSPGELDHQIHTFLKTSSKSASMLILYYSGHGGFSPSGRDYLLTTRSTRSANRGASSIRIADLAETFRGFVDRAFRKFLILDCCFAANAAWTFQSDPLQTAVLRTEEVLPPLGTALLCSSSSRDVSLIPTGEKMTMFSGALMQTLENGVINGPPMLSLEEVGNAVRSYIQRKYSGEGINPEIHVPDQRQGNIAQIGLFPNRAFVSIPVIRKKKPGIVIPPPPLLPQYGEIPSFPDDSHPNEDTQKGRWGGRSRRDGRRLYARIEKAGRGWYRADLVVESTDGTTLRGPVVFYVHETFDRSKQKIMKIQSGLRASWDDIVIAEGPFTVGAEVKRGDGKWIPLELDLSKLAPFRNR